MLPDLNQWLDGFGLDAAIRALVAGVFTDLPQAVREEFLMDPSFRLCDVEPGPAGTHIRVGAPARGLPARSVVLKRSLRRRSPAFARYVIAHELAHAHLRNRGRHPSEDPELAADSLAALWGHPRP